VQDGAYADVTVKLGLIKLLKKEFDLCEEASVASLLDWLDTVGLTYTIDTMPIPLYNVLSLLDFMRFSKLFLFQKKFLRVRPDTTII